MPIEASLTPRQLRTIADRVEQLTKARIDNQAMGVPTTPDSFDCRFPSGHRGTVTWTEAPLTSARARERNGNKPVHRYVVELHAPTAADQVAASGTSVSINLSGGIEMGEAMQRTMRRSAGG